MKSLKIWPCCRRRKPIKKRLLEILQNPVASLRHAELRLGEVRGKSRVRAMHLETRTKILLACRCVVAPASAPQVFDSRTETVRELAAGTAALQCGCQAAP
jgi:hypothetical protein